MICCGKTLCHGCTLAAAKEMDKGNMKQWCAFCRVPYPHSNKEIMKRLKKRMKLNDAEAFFTLGMKYHYGKMGLAQDANKAWELTNRSAELGSVRARYNIAVAFHSGDYEMGVEKNTSKAVHHYKLAAIGGHERARLWLGIIEMSNGHINYAMKQKNWKKSFEMVSRAAELGSINAHYDLSNLYYKGEGVKKDVSKAIHHWKLAAIGGHEIANHNLGNIEYRNGNKNQAMKHYMIAARAGEDNSLKKVGDGYKSGHVTKDDYAATLRAYQMSVDEMKSEQRSIAQNKKKR